MSEAIINVRKNAQVKIEDCFIVPFGEYAITLNVDSVQNNQKAIYKKADLRMYVANGYR